MESMLSRTEILIGKEAINKISKKKVAIFGIGGVGSFVCEGLVRAGIQQFILVDNDVVSVSNINRQIHATSKTIGKYKVDLMKERMLDINPNVKVNTYKEFFISKENQHILDNSVDYVVDAIDTVTGKLELIDICNELNIKIISSMGTGNKLEPTKFEITDIYKTSVCPLAKVMRKELKARHINKLKVIYSKEEPIKSNSNFTGSISFVPSVAGLIIAGEVIKDLIKK